MPARRTTRPEFVYKDDVPEKARMAIEAFAKAVRINPHEARRLLTRIPEADQLYTAASDIWGKHGKHRVSSQVIRLGCAILANEYLAFATLDDTSQEAYTQLEPSLLQRGEGHITGTEAHFATLKTFVMQTALGESQ